MHYTLYYLGEWSKIAESGGEVAANILGLNKGPFEYVTSGMTPEEMLASRAMVESEESKTRREGGGV